MPLSTSWAEASISKQQAASIARTQYPGKIIDVRLIKSGEQPIYRVKVLDKKGGLHIVTIHGQTGNVISAH